MLTERTIRSYLRQSILLAKSLEDITGPIAGQKPLTTVGFGFCVRNRRLAQAILRLGSQHAYEGRMLLRSMIEIQINYDWIRIRERKFRANRFLKYHPVEKLKMFQDLSSVIQGAHYKNKLKKYTASCAKVRHLFRKQTKKGRFEWQKHWATAHSLPSRLMEVDKSRRVQYDPFLYYLYRWTSSAIHGGPQSLYETLETSWPLSAKPQPEIDPVAQIKGAFVILMVTIKSLAEDTKKIEEISFELARLQRAVPVLKLVQKA